MNRFFCLSKNITLNTVIIDDKNQVHHIRDVLRLSGNDKVVVFDEKGNEYECAIEKIQDNVLLKINNIHKPCKGGENIKVAIGCAIPKNSNMADIIDKLTQLGVDRIIPLKTKRVIVKLDKNKEASLHERWKRISLAASQQSQRNSLVNVDYITEINELILNSSDFDLKLIPTLLGKRKSLREAIVNSRHKNILVVIGPEGDFSLEEVELAKKNGFIPVSLGNLVLRVETAAVSVASFIKLYENC
jgi:16S rRNA (uracil1498-N3)-methyltransferase